MSSEFILNELKSKLRIFELESANSVDSSKEDEDEIYNTLFSANGSDYRTSSVLSLSSSRRSIVSSPLKPGSSSIQISESVCSLAKSPVYLTLRRQLEGFRQTIASLSKEKSVLLTTCQELQKRISQLQLNSERSFEVSGDDTLLHDILQRSDNNTLVTNNINKLVAGNINNLVTSSVKNDKYSIIYSPSSPQLPSLPAPISVPNLPNELGSSKTLITTNDINNDFQ